MTITQTIEVPANRRITIEVPREVPAGPVILTFTPKAASHQPVTTQEPNKDRKAGCLKGQIWMADDFDAPLEDFKDYM